MKIHSIRKKLRQDTKFNPFHDSFDESLVSNKIKDLLESEDLDQTESNLLNTLESALSLNLAYHESYDGLRDSFDKVNLNYDEIIGFSIALRNRATFLLHLNDIEQLSEDRDRKSFSDAMRLKVESIDKSIGKIDSQAAIETEVDSLNVVLNYLKYFEKELPQPSSSTPLLQSIEALKYQSFVSIFYYVLKSAYEDAIWRDGYVNFDKNSLVMKVEFEKPDLLQLYKIGVYRLERNSSAFFMMGISFFQEKGLKPIIRLNEYKREGIRIKEVKVSSGKLKYKISNGKEPDSEFFTELSNESALMAYYSFLEDVELPNLQEFTIRKILGLFTILMHLFKKARDINIRMDQTGVFKKSDLFRYPFRIEIQSLKNYLLKRSHSTKEEVEAFLSFIETKDRINFWNEQLLNRNGYYYFLLLPLVSPNILYLIDIWLEKGGVDLGSRGPLFEKSIKDRLDEILTKKNYFFNISNKSKFYNSRNEFEEIDLVLSLKNLIIIAEVKCVKFPFEPREISNSLLRIQKGAQQINRKLKFVKDNSSDLTDDIEGVETKEIVPLVICNYPIFTGFSIEGVQIIDFFLMEAYFSSGRLQQTKITFEKGEIENEHVGELKFYDDEDQCSSNFLDHMKNPPAVEEIKSLVEVKMNKITSDELNYQVYVQAAEFKEL